MSNWVILKFGGSSVADANHWQTITKQIDFHLDANRRPILVLSALKNVSNLLEALLHQSLAGAYLAPIEHLRGQHFSFSMQLGLSVPSEIAIELNPIFKALEQNCELIHKAGSISPLLHAKVVATGELLSSTIGACYLKKHLNNRQVSTEWLDVRKVLKTLSRPSETDDEWHHFSSAECDYSPSPQVQSELATLADVIITQGFIAADQNGNTVLLGREGSDTSAAYLGAILQANEIQIWTDVTGIFSSNPREIEGAIQLEALSYRQASLMAKLGAKVLHPRAVEPAKRHNIPLRVKSTAEPNHSGTLITLEEVVHSKVKHKSHTKDGVIGIVYEPQLMQVSGGSQVDFDRLSTLGFDAIIDVRDLRLSNDQSMSFWAYRNSDKAPPSNEQLKSDVTSDKIKLRQNVGLISLVLANKPVKTSKEWSEKIKRLSFEANIEKYDCLVPENAGFVMVVVKSEETLPFAQFLHTQLC